jgi:hypothetical protein
MKLNLKAIIITETGRNFNSRGTIIATQLTLYLDFLLKFKITEYYN